MKIVLLAHSHVGAGVYDAIKKQGEIVLAAGYRQTEHLVPAPNLIEQWNQAGLRTVGLAKGTKPRYAAWGAAADILISANWRHKIPAEYIERFPLAVNFHGANTILHTYRGRRPIQRQIEDGKQSYFLTCHRLAEEYDAGEILAQNMTTYPFVPSQGMVYSDMRKMAYDLTLWLLENWNGLVH